MFPQWIALLLVLSFGAAANEEARPVPVPPGRCGESLEEAPAPLEAPAPEPASQAKDASMQQIYALLQNEQLGPKIESENLAEVQKELAALMKDSWSEGEVALVSGGLKEQPLLENPLLAQIVYSVFFHRNYKTAGQVQTLLNLLHDRRLPPAEVEALINDMERMLPRELPQPTLANGIKAETIRLQLKLSVDSYELLARAVGSRDEATQRRLRVSLLALLVMGQRSFNAAIVAHGSWWSRWTKPGRVLPLPAQTRTALEAVKTSEGKSGKSVSADLLNLQGSLSGRLRFVEARQLLYKQYRSIMIEDFVFAFQVLLEWHYDERTYGWTSLNRRMKELIVEKAYKSSYLLESLITAIDGLKARNPSEVQEMLKAWPLIQKVMQKSYGWKERDAEEKRLIEQCFWRALEEARQKPPLDEENGVLTFPWLGRKQSALLPPAGEAGRRSKINNQ